MDMGRYIPNTGMELRFQNNRCSRCSGFTPESVKIRGWRAWGAVFQPEKMSERGDCEPPANSGIGVERILSGYHRNFKRGHNRTETISVSEHYTTHFACLIATIISTSTGTRPAADGSEPAPLESGWKQQHRKVQNKQSWSKTREDTTS